VLFLVVVVILHHLDTIPHLRHRLSAREHTSADRARILTLPRFSFAQQARTRNMFVELYVYVGWSCTCVSVHHHLDAFNHTHTRVHVPCIDLALTLVCPCAYATVTVRYSTAS
jgi:hypothetical protein